MSDAAEEEAAPGAPMWMATFADMMSLLMCFFVLLLSFSEMDAQKYKLVAGSMKNAFGVQQDRLFLEDPTGALTPQEIDPNQITSALEQTAEEMMMEQIEELVAETERDVAKLEESLESEINGGQLDLESGFRSITIRIKEQGSFGSGSADMQDSFGPVMAKLRDVLKDVQGKISVEGHSDNRDINTVEFPSNWSLSSARALSVAHALMDEGIVEDDRFIIVGYADTKPFQSNATADGRSANRRVEIVIRQEVSEDIQASIQALTESNPEFVNSLENTEAAAE